MPHGDRESSDRRSGYAVLNLPLNRTSNRIGPVEHDGGKPFNRGSAHDRSDCGGVAVVPRASVLEVDDKGIHIREHRSGRWMESYTVVQQIDRDTGGRVGLLAALGRYVNIDDTTEPMLRRENCCDPKPGGDQAIEIALALSVHAGLVCHQTDPTIADQVEAVGQQYLDSRAHSCRAGCGGRSGSGSGAARTCDAPSPESQ